MQSLFRHPHATLLFLQSLKHMTKTVRTFIQKLAKIDQDYYPGESQFQKIADLFRLFRQVNLAREYFHRRDQNMGNSSAICSARQTVDPVFHIDEALNATS
jgi:hypothetical protein